LAIEYGHHSIRVKCIRPTSARAGLTRALADDKNFDEFFTQSVPLRQWGEAADSANPVSLVSDQSSYTRPRPHRRPRDRFPVYSVKIPRKGDVHANYL
jgi:NAD(P)-dependent dehydrogenase (short-subunit alcohol dehydrogenase family)